MYESLGIQGHKTLRQTCQCPMHMHTHTHAKTHNVLLHSLSPSLRRRTGAFQDRSLEINKPKAMTCSRAFWILDALRARMPVSLYFQSILRVMSREDTPSFGALIISTTFASNPPLNKFFESSKGSGSTCFVVKAVVLIQQTKLFVLPCSR